MIKKETVECVNCDTFAVSFFTNSVIKGKFYSTKIVKKREIKDKKRGIITQKSKYYKEVYYVLLRLC